MSATVGRDRFMRYESRLRLGDLGHPTHAELVDAHTELVSPHLRLERDRQTDVGVESRSQRSLLVMSRVGLGRLAMHLGAPKSQAR